MSSRISLDTSGLDAGAALQAKAAHKLEFVQTMIRRLEKAMINNSEEDRQWLRNLIDPNDTCCRTLVLLVVERKYREFMALRIACLRAVQIILRIAVQMVEQLETVAEVGMTVLIDLVGEPLTQEFLPEIRSMARYEEEPLAACNALQLLGELGPQALVLEFVPRLLQLFEVLPDCADDLVEVSLRIHAWGDEHRATLIELMIVHPGGNLLCEVLLQVINRADEGRKLRAVKVLTGALSQDNSEGLLYTNDVRVLVEILHRDLPDHAEDVVAFVCYADCLKVLAIRCKVARQHQNDDVCQMLQDLNGDDRNELTVREKCAEVLSVISTSDS